MVIFLFFIPLSFPPFRQPDVLEQPVIVAVVFSPRFRPARCDRDATGRNPYQNLILSRNRNRQVRKFQRTAVPSDSAEFMQYHRFHVVQISILKFDPLDGFHV